jgi:hypothetical protein
MTRPRLLDAFCCAGGATRGYQDAGFEVVGVDHTAQPDYCGDDFVQADAVTFIAEHGHEFDAIHASPPCQDHIAITAGNRRRPGWTDNHVNLVVPTRAALAAVRARTGVPTGPGRHDEVDVVVGPAGPRSPRSGPGPASRPSSNAASAGTCAGT